MSPIVVALDGISKERALAIAKTLKGMVWGFKVTDLLFDDPSVVAKLKKHGKVFADAKLHDIPNTVANSTAKLSRLGVDIITVHASGGVEMMRSAKRAAGKSKILAVTVLTSGKDVNAEALVLKFAKDAKAAGLDGIVCSARELSVLSSDPRTKKLIKVVPGIRPAWHGKTDDQKRIATPKEALERGADLLVIGRPIVKARNPGKALDKILKEL